MKKKVLNQSTVIEPIRGLYISVTGKSGIIGLSKQLGDKLTLSSRGINFVQDEDRPADWYIQPSKDANAFEVRSKASNSKIPYHYAVQSTHVCREILDSCRLEKRTHRFIVAGEPVEDGLYAIITKSAKAFVKNGEKEKIPPPTNQRPNYQKLKINLSYN